MGTGTPIVIVGLAVFHAHRTRGRRADRREDAGAASLQPPPDARSIGGVVISEGVAEVALLAPNYERIE